MKQRAGYAHSTVLASGVRAYYRRHAEAFGQRCVRLFFEDHSGNRVGRLDLAPEYAAKIERGKWYTIEQVWL